MIKILFSTGQFLVNACKQDWYSLILQLGKKICKWTGIPVQRAKIQNYYQTLKGLFGKKLNLARIKFVTLFILTLCKTRKVTYTALAIAFDNKTCKDRNIKRIRNMMINNLLTN